MSQVASNWTISAAEQVILRDLAAQMRIAAESERNQRSIQRWWKLDKHETGDPIILTETVGVPLFRAGEGRVPLLCTSDLARGVEWNFRNILEQFKFVNDDNPLAVVYNVDWIKQVSDYGVQGNLDRPKTDGVMGAYHINAAIHDLRADFHKLRPRSYQVDREATYAMVAMLQDALGDDVQVRIRGRIGWTMGLTMDAIHLIGLEELMLYMYDEPEMLHQLLTFLRDEKKAWLQWLEHEGLLGLNNEDDYIGSGSHGYTDTLPQRDWLPGMPYRVRDLWMLLESQETVGVGPDLYEEFIFPYEKSLAELAGRVYYGCCEPVHTRWHILQKMPNLQRVSVSPWCNQAFMAEAMGNNLVFSRKPNPSLVSTAVFDEEAIRDDVRSTLELTKQFNCPVEIIMKDVHTLHGDPTRLGRWAQLAREEVAKIYG